MVNLSTQVMNEAMNVTYWIEKIFGRGAGGARLPVYIQILGTTAKNSIIFFNNKKRDIV